jgi:ABC-type glutathione transport system ATPase component
MSLLEVCGLSTEYTGDGTTIRAADDVTFTLDRGEVLGIVGESGSGKTTVAMSILRLIRPPGRIVEGSVVFEGENLFKRPRARMRELRGVRMALVPQAAMNALDPVYTARSLVSEVIVAHGQVPRVEARRRAGELLESLGIPGRRVDSYPHELSGGMRQRVTIAMALANEPMLVLADEPVTGLDVLVQAQILELLAGLKERLALSMIFISHDLLAVARISDRLLVMHRGRAVEQGPAPQVVHDPQHPYTRTLLAAFPRVDRGAT